MKDLFSKKGDHLAAYLFLAPFLMIYGMFMVYPIIKGMKISLSEWKFGLDPEFVGLKNYKTMLSDGYFWEALGNTLYFVLISTPVLIILGLLVALIVNSGLKGTVFLRAGFFLPFILSISVMASIWVFIFQPYTGLMNSILQKFGVQQEIFWLNEPNLAWMSILIATVWWTLGFNMVLFLAGLQEIPKEHYEAAQIDGAGPVRTFFSITLPSLKNVILLIVVLQTINSFKLFGQPYLMTEGGPGSSTRPLVQYIYEKGFVEQDMGVASSMSYVLFAITILVAIIQFKFFTGKQE
ncbi:sugar ABC transporter permease [Halobacillus andaensis]|uniref:Sugar ABC transporter permease n=1 Tax=Halobacillus andaensis TaxID=1176239 RepID=A0A917B492_HALAA|nr:sugar ABC transporter permease [Halobacillus andaensis]MBP2004322.1 multiple sugar transport system permease protein [Halobacillus andaensis]GGF22522.1 sugar ABC transporter permease [Halobacillus andaensis]